jgi:hypothetical protein
MCSVKKLVHSYALSFPHTVTRTVTCMHLFALCHCVCNASSAHYSCPYCPQDDDIDLENSPSQEKIFEFLMKIFNAESLSAECGVMCMAYIERLLTLTGVTMHASNWRKIVLGALILASKVWEDQAVWNVDFLNVFPNVTVDDLNKLERHYLDALQFNVSLKGSVYAKYYFELRSLSERDAKHFPLKPLDKEGQLRLERRSKGVETQAKKVTRSHSMDAYHSPSTPISLNY